MRFRSPKADEEPAAKVAPAVAHAMQASPALSAVGRDETAARVDSGDVNADFIRETLFAFKHFGVSAVNEDWFKARYREWTAERKPTDVQLKEQTEADRFLETFYSPCTGELWSDAYAQAVVAALPKIEAKSVNVWNPGCGKGYETYSLVAALKKAYPEVRFKVWANDSDLLAI